MGCMESPSQGVNDEFAKPTVAELNRYTQYETPTDVLPESPQIQWAADTANVAVNTTYSQIPATDSFNKWGNQQFPTGYNLGYWDTGLTPDERRRLYGTHWIRGNMEEVRNEELNAGMVNEGYFQYMKRIAATGSGATEALTQAQNMMGNTQQKTQKQAKQSTWIQNQDMNWYGYE